jgi:hypothetical protein
MLLTRRALLAGLPAALAAPARGRRRREAARMADYIGLPPITKKATTDTTGANVGNYTAAFQSSDFNTNVPYFELYRIVITGGVLLASFGVYRGVQFWDQSICGFNGITVWSARNAMPLNPGNDVSIRFAITVSGNAAPSVTLWTRYDAAIRANVANA